MGNRESFEKNMRRRVEAIRHVSDHSIFNELRGKIVDYNYDEKRVTMEYEVGDFHRNGFNIMFGGSLVGMFDITFGTLTSGLGDYDIAPTVQLSTSFLKGVPIGSTVTVKAEAVSTGKTIMNFMGKAYVGDELVGNATGIFKTPRPFKTFR